MGSRPQQDERSGFLHKFTIGGQKGYVLTSQYPEGSLSEVYVKMSSNCIARLQPPHPSDELLDSEEFAKYYSELVRVFDEFQDAIRDQHQCVAGLMDALSKAVSLGLQHEIPLKTFVDLFYATRFPPDGVTNNSKIQIATSILDYIFRYLKIRFLGGDHE